MVELEAVVTCNCGHTQVVPEPEDGPSLFGTASWKALQHTQTCRGTGKVKSRFVENE